jgi:hypothetical protein
VRKSHIAAVAELRWVSVLETGDGVGARRHPTEGKDDMSKRFAIVTGDHPYWEATWQGTLVVKSSAVALGFAAPTCEGSAIARGI